MSGASKAKTQKNLGKMYQNVLPQEIFTYLDDQGGTKKRRVKNTPTKKTRAKKVRTKKRHTKKRRAKKTRKRRR